MRNRKFTFILCMALAAAVALFGVTEGKAGTLIAGWEVSLDNNANVFDYTFDQKTGDKISFVEMLLPLDIKLGGLSVVDEFNDPIAYEVILGPTGDGSTGFGIGLPDKNLIIFKSNNAKSFPTGVFKIIMTLTGQKPANDEMLGAANTVMLLKAGNGQVWDSQVMLGPEYVPIPPPPPPIGSDSLDISVEGHSEYTIRLFKDVYGTFDNVCLLYAADGSVVTDNVLVSGATGDPCCTSEGKFDCHINNDTTVELSLGDLGNSVVICKGGDLEDLTSTDPAPTPEEIQAFLKGCDYANYSAVETQVKGGDTTCGYFFVARRYSYVCF